MFKKSASLELISETTFRALTTVDGLRAGRSKARETEKVKPVDEGYVDLVLPYASEVIVAMMQLQLLTGIRSTELCTIRPCNINMTGKVWLYKPEQHKTLWRGKEKIIAIGPRGQIILKPFLKRKITDYCFVPDESLRLKKKGGKAVNPCYDRCSYRRAICYAITSYNKANPEKQIPFFTPHQSRHTLATKIRKEMGIEAASTAIGDTIEAGKIYAERSLSLAIEIAKKFG